MIALEAKNISKRFPGVLALSNIEIRLECGKIHCIVGENGAGKSTLTKVLTGVYPPDNGSISIFGEDALRQRLLFKRIAYVPQEIDLLPSLSVAENLFIPYSSGMYKGKFVRKNSLNEQAMPILESLRIKAKPTDIVGKIPISEQQLLQIAHALFNKNADIILLDEPTTSLVSTDIGRLFEVLIALKSSNKAIVFISHKLEEVFEIGDQVTVLRNGERVGGADIAECSIPWVIEKMVGQELDLSVRYRPIGCGQNDVLKVNCIAGRGFKNISFTLKEGEILGIAGLVGAGRSEIVQGIFGYKPFWAGSIEVFGKVIRSPTPASSIRRGVMYLPEERKQQGILPSHSVLANLSISLLDRLRGLFGISGSKEAVIGAEIVNKYNIKIKSLTQRIVFLSGGNQQKTIIGRAMFSQPKILIFDEPTKGIDVGAKAEIYRFMKDIAERERIPIILISSEIDEVLKCSNRILVIYNGEKAGEFNTDAADRKDIIGAMIGSGRIKGERETQHA